MLSPALPEMVLSDEIQKRLLGMEGKIVSLEEEMRLIVHGVSEMRREKDERNKIITSLFKMIRTSIAGQN